MTNMNVDATQITTKPSQDGFCMPAEWAPQQAVWMIWPYRPDNWRSAGAYAQATFAKVADAIGAVTPVYMGVPKEFLTQAKTVMPSHVTLVEIDSNDCWARDTGPTVVVNVKGECRGVDWGFNAWGGNNGGLYFPWDKDEQVAQQMLTQHGFERYQAPLILEGGSIHVDGEGTCMTTAECLLNSNRNPDLTREQIEALLADYLNVQQFIWLPEGVYMDETDGHIDNICCFARPGEVVLHWTDDQTDPQYPRSKAALDILQNTVDAQGRKLKVHLLPQPGPLYCTEEEAQGVAEGTGVPRTAGERLAGSYANFLITNNRIVFPLLDPATDDIAAQKLQEIFPEYEIVGVPAREILLGGGNIHCITQQIPSGQ